MILTPHNIGQINFEEGCFILVNKPLGLSSFQIVAGLKKPMSKGFKKQIKIGHAGTLDPLASGLLILCTGKKTKLISQFQDMEKVYSGYFSLGATRPSFDKETEIDQTFPVDHITLEMIENLRISMLGLQFMRPPIHSAVKIGGVRAYKLARKGETPILEPKKVFIHDFILDNSNFPQIKFSIRCSKGTYIRGIANEFGSRLESGAYLESLSRDAIGDYKLSDAWQFDLLINELLALNQR